MTKNRAPPVYPCFSPDFDDTGEQNHVRMPTRIRLEKEMAHKTRFNSISCLCALAATLAFGGVATGNDDGILRLFGTVSGTAVFQGTGPEFSGSGIFSGLGHVTNDGRAVLLAFPPIALEECGGGPGIPNINTEILTAANGDQIVFRMEDVACVVGPNTFAGNGEWTVVSGSGRFAGATGSGVMNGFVDFNIAYFEFKLTGWVEIGDQQ